MSAITETFIAWPPFVRFVRAIINVQGGRHPDFLGLRLEACMLRFPACMLTGALNTLPARDPAAETEIVEILQVVLAKAS